MKKATTTLKNADFPNESISTYSGQVQGHWTSNTVGFHDSELRTKRGTHRIITIGDSFLDGPQTNPLPIVLEQRLRDTDQEFDVINLSRPGIGPELYYPLFRKIALPLKPTGILIFIFEGNDFRSMERPELSTLEDGKFQFFRPFPEDSLISNLFPRISIVIKGLQDNNLITRWTDISNNRRWIGKIETGSVDNVAQQIAPYLEATPDDIAAFLQSRLSEPDLDELLAYPRRLDLLAYFVGVGMNISFTRKLAIKGGRPEIGDRNVATIQVEKVFQYLSAMSADAKDSDIDFAVVLIPTSLVDENARRIYQSLGADKDSLFSDVRIWQKNQLKEKLVASQIAVLDLTDSLKGEKNTYLTYDTHWSVRGVQIASQAVSHFVHEAEFGVSN